MLSRHLAAFITVLAMLLLRAGTNGVLAASAPPALGTKAAAVLPAPGMFLVARRGFLDPNFSQTVVYLLQHDTEATFGLVVNRPGSSSLYSALPYVADTPFASSPVYLGGPMDPDMLVMLIRNSTASPLMRRVVDTIHASVSLQVLNDLLVDHKSPDDVRFYLGYAGWSPGKLERELEHHYWHLLKGDPAAVFGPEAAALWQTLIEQLEPLGVSPEPGGRSQPAEKP
jgi:putative transcriptional regulator